MLKLNTNSLNVIFLDKLLLSNKESIIPKNTWKWNNKANMKWDNNDWLIM